MGYLPMAPSSASVASSPCSRRTYGFSQSQPSSRLFAADHHALLLSQRQRELLSVSVRPKQIQLLVCPAYNPFYMMGSISEPVGEPSITRGKNMLKLAGSQMKSEPKSDYRQAMMKALLMLKEFAADEKNRRDMRETFGLLSTLTDPLISDLHRDDHGAWSGLATETLELMWLLVDDPSRGHTAMKQEMAKQQGEIKICMDGIINCDKCDEHLRTLAKKILANVVKKHYY